LLALLGAHHILHVSRIRVKTPDCYFTVQKQVNTGTAAILVKVLDVEDQSPEFVVATPVTRVSEDAQIGTPVLQGIC